MDGDDSETLDKVFDKCTELFNKLQLDIPETCIDTAHRIGKKTPGRLRQISFGFTTWRPCTMVYRKRKIASILGSLLTLRLQISTEVCVLN